MNGYVPLGGDRLGASGSDNVGMASHDALMHYARAEGKCLLHQSRSYAWRMATPNERLIEARIKAGYASASAAADNFGWKVSTYVQHENGTRGSGSIPRKAAEVYASRFRVSLDWLLTGKGEGPTAPPEPTEAELRLMVEAALRELPVGVTIGDLPHYVAPALHEQLKQFRADRGSADSPGASTVPGKDVRSPAATKQAAEA